ncbi:hypothetical protein Godav_010162, partial [Gossypium davidsonii]|nr:hypothetical protein [Gossypium davidsonii]
MNLRSTIPLYLGNLSFLFSLDLSNNNFYDHLPNELGQLHRLRIIRLSYNCLNGEIPSWLANLHRVQRIHFRDNSLSSGLLDDLCVHLPKLKELYLSRNELSSFIPSSQIEEIGNLFGLEMLSIQAIKGQIPEEIGNLLGLELLSIQAIKGLT